MNNKESPNTFIYRVMERDDKSVKKIAMRMEEELNRGFAFTLSKKIEMLVPLKGEWKGWAFSEIKNRNIYIHVKDEFFNDFGVIEQILTSLWANLLDFGQMRLEEFSLSEKMHYSLLKEVSYPTFIPKHDGPFIGTIFKPSYSLTIKEKAEIAKKFAALGGTFIKEDETYFVDKEKILKEAEVIQSSINEISSDCYYIPNVTQYMLNNEFLDGLYDVGIRIVMVNYLIVGFPIVHKIIKRRKKNKKLIFWGHRVGYKAIERYISMKTVASLAAYSGLNIIHIGTPLFSDTIDVQEALEILNNIKQINNEMIPVFTKASIEILPDLVELAGKKIIVMICGSARTNGEIDWMKFNKFIKGGHL